MSISAVAWALLALALLLGGTGIAGRRGATRLGAASGRAERRGAARVPARALPLVAAACSAVGSVALLGPARGALVAAAAAPVSGWLVARLAARPARAGPDPSLPFALDLVAAALRAGAPLDAALLLAAPAAGPATGAQLSRVGRLVRLGADPDEAWGELLDDAVLAPLARAARRSAESGIRLADGLERVAREARATRADAARARAQRAGVLAVAPLGACFLPAFVCLGIVPVIAGIAATVLP